MAVSVSVWAREAIGDLLQQPLAGEGVWVLGTQGVAATLPRCVHVAASGGVFALA